MIKKFNSAGVGLAIVSMIGMISGPALADTQSNTNQTVAQVEYFQNSLTVQLADGTNLLATTNASPCSTTYNVNVDTIKIWQSQAQAALLSGHKLTIYYALCSANSIRYIEDVVLTNG